MHRRFILLWFFVAAALPGCGGGPRVGEVEGTVTVNGKPVGKLQVAFYPERAVGEQRLRSIGFTDAEGKYRLRCDNQMAGAMVGTHKVVVIDMLASPGSLPSPRVGPNLPRASEEGEDAGDRSGADDGKGTTAKKGGGRPAREARIALAYATVALTPLRHEVKDGSQIINLELKKR
jgi:hypothetical protein